MTSTDLRERFLMRAGLSDQPSLWEFVEAVREIPYGRPSVRTPAGVVEEWRGTCSTKHALLVELLAGRPEFDVRLVHRVYRLDRDSARERFGEQVAAHVPDEGLVDVHTYATAIVGGERVRIDVTFPGPLWDGRSDMPLACGDGEDHQVGDRDPWELKEELVAAHCDPAVREPFIAALAA
jgi:hypothetical protein